MMLCLHWYISIYCIRHHILLHLITLLAWPTKKKIGCSYPANWLLDSGSYNDLRWVTNIVKATFIATLFQANWRYLDKLWDWQILHQFAQIIMNKNAQQLLYVKQPSLNTCPLSISDPQFKCTSSYLSLSVDLHADNLILQICCGATGPQALRASCFVSVCIQVTFINPSVLSKIIKSHVGLWKVCFFKYHSVCEIEYM